MDTNNNNNASQETSATTAFRSGDIISTRLNEDS